MANEIESQPQRDEKIVREGGSQTDQIIDFFSDITLRLNEWLLGAGVKLPAYTKVPDQENSLPDAVANQQMQIYVLDDVGGPTPAYSDGTDWRRYKDGAVIS